MALTVVINIIWTHSRLLKLPLIPKDVLLISYMVCKLRGSVFLHFSQFLQLLACTGRFSVKVTWDSSQFIPIHFLIYMRMCS